MIFNRLVGIPYVALLVPPMVHLRSLNAFIVYTLYNIIVAVLV